MLQHGSNADTLVISYALRINIMIMRRHVLASFATLCCTIMPGEGQALERGKLVEIAARLVEIYQASDADALHGLLASDLQSRYSPPVLSRWLAEAQKTYGMIERISMPTYGSRIHGVFAVYVNGRPMDMYLEIDKRERVVFWGFNNASTTLTLRRK
jgi:hypothetical protein